MTTRTALVCLAALLVVACRGEPEDLSEQQMAPVIAAGKPKLHECYQAALDNDTTLREIKLEAAIHIGVNGEVFDLELSTGGPDGMRTCIEKAIRGWKFPRAKDSTHAALPLVFRPEASSAQAPDPSK